jgi:catechol 2,3-dioxygenase-like lactoylglutathione lyase family enzyme
MMALGPLGQIHLTISDLDRSVAFYRDVLGIPLIFVVPDQSMAFFMSGDVRLYLGKPESPEFATRSMLYFWVPDIEAEFTRLSGLGVEMADKPHVVHRDHSIELWMSACADPDGHHIVLMQERPLP